MFTSDKIITAPPAFPSQANSPEVVPVKGKKIGPRVAELVRGGMKRIYAVALAKSEVQS